ncbi:response regulator transcription factor [Methylobacter sp. S3L5C]|uniref:response regulator transcription factor n=1 Tax=Methylobacter sp. S3L5C TaxID=2839024 RepID=UPI001FAC45BD|nr:response regulator [Methylobacter sp. S3L5C]UOA09941.1 response regulator [Methylobacter sp. S3L5C]
MSSNKSDALVYLVDDEFSVRDSLALMIESTGQAVRSFDSPEAFLNNYDPKQLGCLLLDVRMPTMSGLQLQEELLIRDIFIPIIFISGHARIPDSAKAFRAGAVDFLEKPFDNEILLERIAEALKKDLTNRNQLDEYNKIKKRLAYLTLREEEVLSLIVKGLSNKEVAKMLEISNRTVEAHRARIMEKMQAECLADLVMMTTHSIMYSIGLNKS